MELLNIQVGTLARENFAIIQLFKKNNIDFFCKGSRSLKEALDESGAEKESFLKALEEIRSGEPKQYAVDVEKWPLDLLADFIQKTHHRFTDRILLEIKDLIKTNLANGTDEVEIIDAFNSTFNILAAGLVTHMKKEELMLFPVIKKMVAQSASGNIPMPGSVGKTIETMIDEHDSQFQALRKIRAVLDNYATKDGKEDYNKMVLLMQELDEDLPFHIHLENNILFPKAVELANKLN